MVSKNTSENANPKKGPPLKIFPISSIIFKKDLNKDGYKYNTYKCKGG